MGCPCHSPSCSQGPEGRLGDTCYCPWEKGGGPVTQAAALEQGDEGPGLAQLSPMVPGKAEPPNRHPPLRCLPLSLSKSSPSLFLQSPGTQGGSPGELRSPGLLVATPAAGNALHPHRPTVHCLTPEACLLPACTLASPRLWLLPPQGQRATLAQQLAGAEQSAGDGGSWGWLGLGRQCLVWDTAGTELPGPGL